MADKNILVFGDSNAWGWVPQPDVLPSSRLPRSQRWPEIMSDCLGPEVDVFCDALSARTTELDDPMNDLDPYVFNGLRALPGAIAAHMPLDLVCIALGTNDFKEHYQRSVSDIARSIVALGRSVAGNTGVSTTYPPARVLILCPPPLGPLHPEDWVQEVFSQASLDKSRALAGVLMPMAKAAGFVCFDAGRVMATEGVDSIHFSVANHHNLGRALAEVVREIL